MSIITSPELFINMKSIPQEGDRDFDAFLKYELDKLQYGITINGVKISNWLYWHINYWKAYIPTLDTRSGEVKDKFVNPTLRDNEWFIDEKLTWARDQKTGLLLIGGRRIAKTSIVASWLSLNATIYQGSQNVIVGNNKGDIRNITLQMDKGLSAVEPFLRHDRLLDDWGKEVELGLKEKKVGGRRFGWSNIYIKNTDEGVNTEVLAGLTPKSLVYDEVGKAPTKEAFLAGLKAFASPYGWRCVPILTGTGGDFTKGKDAEEMFHNPERFNLLAVEVPNENRKTAVFMPGNYATDYPKKPMPLSEYLNIDKGSELDTLDIYITQWDVSNKMIDDELEKWEKANDQKEYLKALMYSPRTVDQCFMSNTNENPFPVEALKKHLDFLTRVERPKEYVKLYRDVDNTVKTTNTNLKPVFEYPVKRDTIKDAPVVIYERPIPNPPDFLYIAGGDPYNQSQSDTSPSLGTIYVYKRTYDPVAGTYQKRLVASYTARPEEMKTWHQTAEMLLEYYNATCMIENIGTNFIQYMENKNKAYYLADGYNLAKELNPKSQAMVGKNKGLPATGGVQGHYKNLIIDYLTEEVSLGNTDPETDKLNAVMGLVRIDDPMLITELINYRETEFKKGGGNKKKGNFDRYVSFGHVLVYDEYLEKIAPLVHVKELAPIEKKEPPKVHSPFITKSSNSPFGKARNAFGIR